MSRTSHKRKAAGIEFWSRRPLSRAHGAKPGPVTKRITHGIERAEARAALHKAAVLGLLLMLAGCQTQPERPQLPEIVKVPVRVTVPVPEKLTAPCPVARAETRTVEAVVEAYNSNVETLEACNARMREIRSLPVGEVP